MAYNTKLGEFCATNENWEELLTTEPYNILIKKEDGFVIFNYNQLSSDFSNEIVCEARGIIFREGEWEYPVCHAFDKFFNYGQEEAAQLDWRSVTVSEKIDGSIMKLWAYNGCWHVSTNGMIDAKKAPVPDVRRDDFDQLFWEAAVIRLAGGCSSVAEWLHELDTSYTYIFELVSPYTRVVIPYERTDLYFLGARNNKSNYQFGCDRSSADILHTEMFRRPKLFTLRTLGQVLEAANELPWDNEGYVCYDKDFNRCKIKSPKYVLAHFARNNNVVTRKHLIDIILRGEMDEFLIYAADYADQINYTKQLMDDFTYLMDDCALLTRNLRKLERAEAAEIIKKFHKLVRPIMFMNLGRHVGGREYTYNWTVNKWERVLEDFIKFTVQKGRE